MVINPQKNFQKNVPQRNFIQIAVNPLKSILSTDNQTSFAMQPINLLIDDAVPYAKELFGHLGRVTLKPGKEIQAQDVKNIDALIIRSRTQIQESLLKDSAVTFVGSTVVGLDHVDQDYLKKRNITFYSAQGCNSNSVAEFVINALFEVAVAKKFSLQDKTLGIIGVGNVGSRLLKKAQALGIKCLVNDPPRQQREPEAFDYVSLDEALTADIISVHTPLTQSGQHPTHNLISAEKLRNIQPNQILINAARGSIINEQAWIHTPTLANIIDCWENEPHINEALYQTAFFATPHIAGHSFEAKLAGSEMVYQALCRFLHTAEQQHWQSHLPRPQQAITPPPLSHSQTIYTHINQTFMQKLFRNCHNIYNDHAGISASTIKQVHQKYEKFRRNYPIYHEWHRQTVYSTGQETIDKQLKNLGFKIL